MDRSYPSRYLTRNRNVSYYYYYSSTTISSKYEEAFRHTDKMRKERAVWLCMVKFLPSCTERNTKFICFLSLFALIIFQIL